MTYIQGNKLVHKLKHVLYLTKGHTHAHTLCVIKVIDITNDDNRVVQNILVSDDKATAKVALWQDFLDSVTLIG